MRSYSLPRMVVAEVAVGHGGDGLVEEGEAVLPPGCLDRGENEVEQDQDRAGRAEGPEGEPPAPGRHLIQTPHDQPSDADRGDVCVAVGHRLDSHLDQADRGQRRDEKPKPADDQVRPPPSVGNRQRRDRQQEARRGGAPEVKAHGQRRLGVDEEEPLLVDHGRVRIENGQIHRPDHLPQIEHVGDRGVGQAVAKRQGVGGIQRAGRLLAVNGHDGRAEGNGQQGDFFDPKQVESALGKSGVGRAGGRRLRTHPLPSLQRPIVQENQRARQADGHRLRHHRQHHAGQHRQVAKDMRPLGVPSVNQQGENPEQRAERVLSLGRPGDRLHSQRMQGEQGRRHRTGPKRPGHHADGQKRSTALAAWRATLTR